MIKAAVIITQCKCGEAMLVCTYAHSSCRVGGHISNFIPSPHGGAKGPSINCLHICDHSEKPGFMYICRASVKLIVTYMSDIFHINELK